MKHTEFLFCQKQYAEIGLDGSKIMILMLKIKERSGKPKTFEDEESEILLHEDSCQAQAELV